MAVRSGSSHIDHTASDDKNRRIIVVIDALTHISRIEFPTIINWNSPFLLLGLLGYIYHFYRNSDRIFCKQTVETLARRRVLQRLVWFCTVCLMMSQKRTLGSNGLMKSTSGYVETLSFQRDYFSVFVHNAASGKLQKYH